MPLSVSGPNKPSATLSNFILCSSLFVCALHLITSVVKIRPYVLCINVYQLPTLLTKQIFLFFPVVWWYEANPSCSLESTNLLLLMPTPRPSLGIVTALKSPSSPQYQLIWGGFGLFSKCIYVCFGLFCKCIYVCFAWSLIFHFSCGSNLRWWLSTMHLLAHSSPFPAG